MGNHLKKYNKLSILIGSVLSLSGCGQVSDISSNDKNVSSTVNSTTIFTTSVVPRATTSVEKETESFSYDGNDYEEFVEHKELISYCNYVKDMSGKYVYMRYNDFYTITDEDSVDDLCRRFNITVDEFYEINKDVESFSPGVVVEYPVMDELYVASKGDSVDYISIDTGVDKEIINSNNHLSCDVIEYDTYLLLHRFNGNENSYVTNNGVVNIINNNRIYGNKIIQAGGYTGASKHILVLNESVYSYGTNEVVSYTFIDDSNYRSNVICNNAKDIDKDARGMPVALLRTDSDIEALASSAGVIVDAMAYMQWGSTVSDNYPICTSGDISYIIMNGAEINDLDIDNFTKSK